MSKHTPGPWTADGHVVKHPDSGQCLAECLNLASDAGSNFANARLIAAAPEMLAALQFIAPSLDPDTVGGAEVLRAIAKAKGE